MEFTRIFYLYLCTCIMYLLNKRKKGKLALMYVRSCVQSLRPPMEKKLSEWQKRKEKRKTKWIKMVLLLRIYNMLYVIREKMYYIMFIYTSVV